VWVGREIDKVGVFEVANNTPTYCSSEAGMVNEEKNTLPQAAEAEPSFRHCY